MHLFNLLARHQNLPSYAQLAKEHGVNFKKEDGEIVTYHSGAIVHLEDRGPKTERLLTHGVERIAFVQLHGPHDMYELMVTAEGKFFLGQKLARVEYAACKHTYANEFNDYDDLHERSIFITRLEAL